MYNPPPHIGKMGLQRRKLTRPYLSQPTAKTVIIPSDYSDETIKRTLALHLITLWLMRYFINAPPSLTHTLPPFLPPYTLQLPSLPPSLTPSLTSLLPPLHLPSLPFSICHTKTAFFLWGGGSVSHRPITSHERAGADATQP